MLKKREREPNKWKYVHTLPEPRNPVMMVAGSRSSSKTAQFLNILLVEIGLGLWKIELFVDREFPSRDVMENDEILRARILVAMDDEKCWQMEISKKKKKNGRTPTTPLDFRV